MFFSVGLTHPDNIHQQFHAGELFHRASARSQGACMSARLARATLAPPQATQARETLLWPLIVEPFKIAFLLGGLWDGREYCLHSKDFVIF